MKTYPAVIPVNIPDISGNEKKYLAECIDTGWISSEGPFIARFEKEFSQKIGRKYGIAVCNGSAALEVAVACLDIQKGDEVIMPSFTIISCAAPVVRSGAIPVLIDADERTWNMDVSQIEAKITKKTKAIMVVHIYGLPVDMDPVLRLAKKYNLKIVEDAAEAHGLTYNGSPCGSFGDISIFSFYPNKLITTGEGGMVLTDNEELAKRAASLRNLCFLPEKRFVHEELGWNMRMTNMQAAIGVAQLERFDAFVKRKRAIGHLYNDGFKDLKELQLPVAKTNYAENIYWVYGVMLRKTYMNSAKLAMKRLFDLGVATRPFFYPLHLQPVFRKMGLFRNVHLPVSENLYERGFYIPSGLGLSDRQIEEVIERVKKEFT